jgi:hypothetical protein
MASRTNMIKSPDGKRKDMDLYIMEELKVWLLTKLKQSLV